MWSIRSVQTRKRSFFFAFLISISLDQDQKIKRAAFSFCLSCEILPDLLCLSPKLKHLNWKSEKRRKWVLGIHYPGSRVSMNRLHTRHCWAMREERLRDGWLLRVTPIVLHMILFYSVFHKSINERQHKFHRKFWLNSRLEILENQNHF